MRHFYARASWPEGCDPTSMPNDEENLTCSLDRQHLIRTCFVDFDRSIVLVAEVLDEGEKSIVGAGRISREEMSDDFTFSLQVLLGSAWCLFLHFCFPLLQWEIFFSTKKHRRPMLVSFSERGCPIAARKDFCSSNIFTRTFFAAARLGAKKYHILQRATPLLESLRYREPPSHPCPKWRSSDARTGVQDYETAHRVVYHGGCCMYQGWCVQREQEGLALSGGWIGLRVGLGDGSLKSVYARDMVSSWVSLWHLGAWCRRSTKLWCLGFVKPGGDAFPS